ncbi:hypothetical protein [uncultured Sphaerochaeta sp.]|nr:hypothetical protein [uncultured Sphaerochaeta sp.]
MAMLYGDAINDSSIGNCRFTISNSAKSKIPTFPIGQIPSSIRKALKAD